MQDALSYLFYSTGRQYLGIQLLDSFFIRMQPTACLCYFTMPPALAGDERHRLWLLVAFLCPEKKIPIACWGFGDKTLSWFVSAHLVSPELLIQPQILNFLSPLHHLLHPVCISHFLLAFPFSQPECKLHTLSWLSQQSLPCISPHISLRKEGHVGLQGGLWCFSTWLSQPPWAQSTARAKGAQGMQV